MALDIYDVQQSFPLTDYIRGMQYYHQRRVRNLRWESVQGHHRVNCQVQGTELYDVFFGEVAPGRLDGDCTCPRFEEMGVCKHLAVAMICFVLDKPKDVPPVTDRAHRIGQKSYVQVYRLIAQNTIEEKILELQDRKSALTDAISGENDSSILTTSKEDLLKLLQ